MVTGPRPFRHKPGIQKMIDGARNQVQGDNRRLSSMHSQLTSLLILVGIFDQKISHCEGAVSRGGKDVLALLTQKKHQDRELARATMAAESACPPTPSRATSVTERTNGSQRAPVIVCKQVV